VSLLSLTAFRYAHFAPTSHLPTPSCSLAIATIRQVAHVPADRSHHDVIITFRGVDDEPRRHRTIEDRVAQPLLRSSPVRLAHTRTDATPRVLPIWFRWNGTHFVLGSLARAPKLKALQAHPAVALTIDDNTFPYKILLIRSNATIEMQPDVVAEYT
jgi:hypothetical protein